jgi:hypothetical protein
VFADDIYSMQIARQARYLRERKRKEEKKGQFVMMPSLIFLLLPWFDSSRVGLVDPSFRALAGSLTLTDRRHTFNEDSLFDCCRGQKMRKMLCILIRSTNEEE